MRGFKNKIGVKPRRRRIIEKKIKKIVYENTLIQIQSYCYTFFKIIKMRITQFCSCIYVCKVNICIGSIVY